MLCECLVGMDLYVNLRQGSSEEEILVVCVVFYLKSMVILNMFQGFIFYYYQIVVKFLREVVFGEDLV